MTNRSSKSMAVESNIEGAVYVAGTFAGGTLGGIVGSSLSGESTETGAGGVALALGAVVSTFVLGSILENHGLRDMSLYALAANVITGVAAYRANSLSEKAEIARNEEYESTRGQPDVSTRNYLGYARQAPAL